MPIKKSYYKIPGKLNEKMEAPRKKLKNPIAILIKLREPVPLRKEK